jgi:WxcM-like, C-terminal
MNENKKPYFIEFNSFGIPSTGYISVAEQLINIPFEIKRTYWTYYTPQSVTRGGHANIDKELVLVAVAGTIKVTAELQGGYKKSFVLDKPHIGLYLPRLCWHTMQYSHNAVQVVLASNFFSMNDYIRDYETFLKYGQ